MPINYELFDRQQREVFERARSVYRLSELSARLEPDVLNALLDAATPQTPPTTWQVVRWTIASSVLVVAIWIAPRELGYLVPVEQAVRYAANRVKSATKPAS